MPSLLLIEDNDDVQEILRTFLTSCNPPYNIIQARSFEQALEIFQTTPINLIVSDIAMPGMSIGEFMTQLMKFYIQPKIILFTGLRLECLPPMPKEIKIECVIHKPFDLDDFERRIAEAIKERPIKVY